MCPNSLQFKHLNPFDAHLHSSLKCPFNPQLKHLFVLSFLASVHSLPSLVLDYFFKFYGRFKLLVNPYVFFKLILRFTFIKHYFVAFVVIQATDSIFNRPAPLIFLVRLIVSWVNNIHAKSFMNIKNLLICRMYLSLTLFSLIILQHH